MLSSSILIFHADQFGNTLFKIYPFGFSILILVQLMESIHIFIIIYIKKEYWKKYDYIKRFSYTYIALLIIQGFNTLRLVVLNPELDIAKFILMIILFCVLAIQLTYLLIMQHKNKYN